MPGPRGTLDGEGAAIAAYHRPRMGQEPLEVRLAHCEDHVTHPGAIAEQELYRGIIGVEALGQGPGVKRPAYCGAVGVRLDIRDEHLVPPAHQRDLGEYFGPDSGGHAGILKPPEKRLAP